MVVQNLQQLFILVSNSKVIYVTITCKEGVKIVCMWGHLVYLWVFFPPKETQMLNKVCNKKLSGSKRYQEVAFRYNYFLNISILLRLNYWQ